MDINKLFQTYTGGNNNVGSWTPFAIKEFAKYCVEQSNQSKTPIHEENEKLAREFLEEKNGANDWNYYPPSKEVVIIWLIEYSNQSKKELLDVLENINSLELESTYPGFNKETRILEVIPVTSKF